MHAPSYVHDVSSLLHHFSGGARPRDASIRAFPDIHSEDNHPSLAEATGSVSAAPPTAAAAVAGKTAWLPPGPCECDPRQNHGRITCHLRSLLFKAERRWCRIKANPKCRGEGVERVLMYCHKRVWFANETALKTLDQAVAANQTATRNKEVSFKSRHRQGRPGAEKAHKAWRRNLAVVDKSQAVMSTKLGNAKDSTRAYEAKMRRLADSHSELHQAYRALAKAEQALPSLLEKQDEQRERIVKEKEAVARAKALAAVDALNALNVDDQVTLALTLSSRTPQ
jgi:hypothetical protein